MKKRKLIFTCFLMTLIGLDSFSTSAQTQLKLGDKLERELQSGEDHQYVV